MTTINPLEQFDIHTIFDFTIAGYSFGFTNATLFMALSLVCLSTFMLLATRNANIIPKKLQASGELMHNFILDTLNANTLGKGEKYFPLIFSIFCFVLTMNVLGLIPHGFTATSHLSVTIALALIIFIILNIIAFSIHGMKFFHFFLPEGIPLILAPIMIVIELFVYLIRPFTLSVRLTANMIAGHVVLFILSSFIVMGGIKFGIIPLSFVVALTGFEIFVSILQAYIFTILTCTYLNDAINLH
jgi:F-type H+-transporting ATPase subunit a